jgi:hypothetical protein
MSLIKVQQSERAGSDEQRVQGASPSMSKREAEDKPSSKNGIEQDEEIFHNRGEAHMSCSSQGRHGSHPCRHCSRL